MSLANQSHKIVIALVSEASEACTRKTDSETHSHIVAAAGSNIIVKNDVMWIGTQKEAIDRHREARLSRNSGK
jgi:hypothetical protein